MTRKVYEQTSKTSSFATVWEKHCNFQVLLRNGKYDIFLLRSSFPSCGSYFGKVIFDYRKHQTGTNQLINTNFHGKNKKKSLCKNKLQQAHYFENINLIPRRECLSKQNRHESLRYVCKFRKKQGWKNCHFFSFCVQCSTTRTE